MGSSPPTQGFFSLPPHIEWWVWVYRNGIPRDEISCCSCPTSYTCARSLSTGFSSFHLFESAAVLHPQMPWMPLSWLTRAHCHFFPAHPGEWQSLIKQILRLKPRKNCVEEKTHQRASFCRKVAALTGDILGITYNLFSLFLILSFAYII